MDQRHAFPDGGCGLDCPLGPLSLGADDLSGVALSGAGVPVTAFGWFLVAVVVWCLVLVFAASGIRIERFMSTKDE